MAQFKSIKNDPYYRNQIPIHSGPKPEAHFYPDITDEVLRSNKYDIDFTLSYADALKKIEKLEDIWTIQMGLANAKTAESYNCFIHYLDTENDTQKVAIVTFNMRGEAILKEWV